jgi:hypothetical protein
MADYRINSLVLAAGPLSSSPTSATKSAKSGHGRNRSPPAVDLGAAGQRTTLQGNAPYLVGF